MKISEMNFKPSRYDDDDDDDDDDKDFTFSSSTRWLFTLKLQVTDYKKI